MSDRESIEALREVIVPRWGVLRERDVWRRVQARGPKSRAPGPWILAAAAIVVAVVWGGWMLLRASPIVEPSVTSITSAPPVAPPTEREAKGGPLRFTDGTVIQPDTDAELVVERADEDEASVLLHTGRAHFSVASRPVRRFVVQSGLVSVVVVGTEFFVERRGTQTWVEVERGEVQVEWPGDHTSLRAGESGLFPPSASVATPAPSDEVVAGPSWRTLAQRGEHRSAFDALRDDAAKVRSTPADLMLAADVARVSGHDGHAVRYLRRLTTRFPRDPRAPLAAFTTGRIELSRGRGLRAAEAFALARRLQPEGSLAEHALAREVEARVAAKQPARARELASTYLRRYPRGPRRALVRTMTQQ